jgi:hypothetical protein
LIPTGNPSVDVKARNISLLKESNTTASFDRKEESLRPPLLELALRQLQHDRAGDEHRLALLSDKVRYAFHIEARLDYKGVAGLDAGEDTVVHARLAMWKLVDT